MNNTLSPEQRDKLIVDHMPNVKGIVDHMIKSKRIPIHIDWEDLYQTAYIALIKCADKFDGSKGNKFYTFFCRRIQGSVIDYLREQDILPRDVRKKMKQEGHDEGNLIQFSSLLEGSKNSLKQEIGMYWDATQDPMFHGAFIDWSMVDDIENDDRRKALSYLIKKELDQQEKMVIEMSTVKELEKKEIGKLMNISETRVHQIQRKAINKLKAAA